MKTITLQEINDQTPGTTIDLVQRTVRKICQCCLLDVGFVLVHRYAPSEQSETCINLSYTGDLSFEILERLSVALGTKLIDIGCDTGTGSDPCHDRELYIKRAIIPIPEA